MSCEKYSDINNKPYRPALLCSPTQNIPVNVQAVNLTSASLAHTLCLSLQHGVYYMVAHIAHHIAHQYTTGLPTLSRLDD